MERQNPVRTVRLLGEDGSEGALSRPGIDRDVVWYRRNNTDSGEVFSLVSVVGFAIFCTGQQRLQFVPFEADCLNIERAGITTDARRHFTPLMWIVLSS